MKKIFPTHKTFAQIIRGVKALSCSSNWLLMGGVTATVID